jgi:negative regulator of sigma E activity
VSATWSKLLGDKETVLDALVVNPTNIRRRGATYGTEILRQHQICDWLVPKRRREWDTTSWSPELLPLGLDCGSSPAMSLPQLDLVHPW